MLSTQRSPSQKSRKWVTFLLLLTLLSPAVSSVGCAWMPKHWKMSNPFHSKKDASSGRTKKDPGVPTTMDEMMMQRRNDLM